MNKVIFGAAGVMYMAALVVSGRLAVRLKGKTDAVRLEVAGKWVWHAVLKAQQVLRDRPGKDRKAYVTGFLGEILADRNIPTSGEQVDVLVEAAVKQMKMQERRTNRILGAFAVPTAVTAKNRE